MNAAPFRFGVNLRGTPSRAAWAQKARRVEALGYDILNVPDHLADLPAPFPALVAGAGAAAAAEILHQVAVRSRRDRAAGCGEQPTRSDSLARHFACSTASTAATDPPSQRRFFSPLIDAPLILFVAPLPADEAVSIDLANTGLIALCSHAPVRRCTSR